MSTQTFTERTLVLLKPDSVQRGLVGQILSRFEDAGLKIVALKIVRPPRAFIEKHYPNTPDWIRGMGEKSLSNYKDLGKDPLKEVGTADAMAIGECRPNAAVINGCLRGRATESMTCGGTAEKMAGGRSAVARLHQADDDHGTEL